MKATLVLVALILVICAASAEDKPTQAQESSRGLSDSDAKTYLLKKNAAAEAENAILMRYAQHQQQKEAQQKAFEEDMNKLQQAAQKAAADLKAKVEALRKAAKCDACELDKDLIWQKPKPIEPSPTPARP